MMKSLLVSLIKFFLKLAEQSSLLRRIAVFILKPFPSIKNRLVRIVIGSGYGHNSSIKQRTRAELTVLTPHARQIYTQLKTAIDKNKRITD